MNLEINKEMNIGALIFDLEQPTKKLIRNIEKFEKKLIHLKYDLVFNETCIREQLLPRYTNIYIYVYIYIYIYIYI